MHRLTRCGHALVPRLSSRLCVAPQVGLGKQSLKAVQHMLDSIAESKRGQPWVNLGLKCTALPVRGREVAEERALVPRRRDPWIVQATSSNTCHTLIS
jgi:hypothetical protein